MAKGKYYTEDGDIDVKALDDDLKRDLGELPKVPAIDKAEGPDDDSGFTVNTLIGGMVAMAIVFFVGFGVFEVLTDDMVGINDTGITVGGDNSTTINIMESLSGFIGSNISLLILIALMIPGILIVTTTIYKMFTF